MPGELYDESSDSVLIESNGITQIWVATPIYSVSIVFSETSISIASVIKALTQHLC